MHDTESILQSVRDRGFAVVPGFLGPDEIAPAIDELPLMFPTAEEFIADVDPARNARFRSSQFGGVDILPFASVEWSLLAVHPKLVGLAEAWLETDDIRLYQVEAWAKYGAAIDYDQELHRDYFNHTPMVPTDDVRFGQLEMFVYLTDVTPDMGPTLVVPIEHSADTPPIPHMISRQYRPELYEREEPVLGPAGTLLVYHPNVVHRGSAMTATDAARFTLHLNFRAAAAEWALRAGWGGQANRAAWPGFVERCSPRQLHLFGVPLPGHPFWTEHTVAGMALRYPGLDVTPWRAALAAR